MKINLHIEKLVLDGIEGNSAVLAEAVRSEMAALLSSNAKLMRTQNDCATQQTQAKSIHVEVNATPTHWGKSIAHLVYGEITK
jgi:hypothetical protein